MRIPLNLQLTLAVGLGMPVILVWLGIYGYLRVRSDLLASVDEGLRSRAQVLANSLTQNEVPKGFFAEGKLIDPDEAFAQVLDASGRIIQASSAVSTTPLITVGELRSVSKPGFTSPQTGDA